MPVLPGVVAAEIALAAGLKEQDRRIVLAAVRFRALAFLDPALFPKLQPPTMAAAIRQPAFDTGLVERAAVRLSDRTQGSAGCPLSRPHDAGRCADAEQSGSAPPVTVLPQAVLDIVNAQVGLPLHAADLSGYGLSCFSNWHDDSDTLGISKVPST